MKLHEYFMLLAFTFGVLLGATLCASEGRAQTFPFPGPGRATIDTGPATWCDTNSPATGEVFCWDFEEDDATCSQSIGTNEPGPGDANLTCNGSGLGGSTGALYSAAAATTQMAWYGTSMPVSTTYCGKFLALINDTGSATSNVDQIRQGNGTDDASLFFRTDTDIWRVQAGSFLLSPTIAFTGGVEHWICYEYISSASGGADDTIELFSGSDCSVSGGSASRDMGFSDETNHMWLSTNMNDDITVDNWTFHEGTCASVWGP